MLIRLTKILEPFNIEREIAPVKEAKISVAQERTGKIRKPSISLSNDKIRKLSVSLNKSPLKSSDVVSETSEDKSDLLANENSDISLDTLSRDTSPENVLFQSRSSNSPGLLFNNNYNPDRLSKFIRTPKISLSPEKREPQSEDSEYRKESKDTLSLVTPELTNINNSQRISHNFNPNLIKINNRLSRKRQSRIKEENTESLGEDIGSLEKNELLKINENEERQFNYQEKSSSFNIKKSKKLRTPIKLSKSKMSKAQSERKRKQKESIDTSQIQKLSDSGLKLLEKFNGASVDVDMDLLDDKNRISKNNFNKNNLKNKINSNINDINNSLNVKDTLDRINTNVDNLNLDEYSSIFSHYNRI